MTETIEEIGVKNEEGFTVYGSRLAVEPTRIEGRTKVLLRITGDFAP
jgi:hypothetical protein